MRRKLVIDGNAVYEIDDECESHRLERENAAKSQITSESHSSSVNISMGNAGKRGDKPKNIH